MAFKGRTYPEVSSLAVAIWAHVARTGMVGFAVVVPLRHWLFHASHPNTSTRTYGIGDYAKLEAG